MKKLLFVDDEQHVLDGLRDLLRRNRREWEMRFALGPEAALGEMARDPADIVVTDMRMPRMDGAELLVEIQKRYPRAVRMILSGHSEVEAATRAAAVAHQFLSKPCDAGVLEKAIRRTCGWLDLVHDDRVQATIGSVGPLPAQPRIHARVVERLKDPHVTSAGLAEVLEQDVVMSAKILQISNSAFFGRQHRVTRLTDAITYLGSSMIRNLTLSLAVFDPSSLPTNERFDGMQRHAFQVAQVARSIRPPSVDADDAFLAGMLHDFGLLLLLTKLPQHFEQMTSTLRTAPADVHTTESNLFGVTHAELGAYLLGLWNLPFPVVEAVALHHRVAHAPVENPLVMVVHVADVLAQEAAEQPGPIPESQMPRLDMDSLRSQGWEDRIEECRARARAAIQAAREAA